MAEKRSKVSGQIMDVLRRLGVLKERMVSVMIDRTIGLPRPGRIAAAGVAIACPSPRQHG